MGGFAYNLATGKYLPVEDAEVFDLVDHTSTLLKTKLSLSNVMSHFVLDDQRFLIFLDINKQIKCSLLKVNEEADNDLILESSINICNYGVSTPFAET